MVHLSQSFASIKSIEEANQATLLMACRRLLKKVSPKYIVLKSASQSPSAIETLLKAKNTWLRAELKKWYRARDYLSSHFKLAA